MYFKLNPLIKINFDKLGGCLYDCNNSDMICLNKEYADVLKKAMDNCNEFSIDEMQILNELHEKGYGNFYYSPVYIESPRYGMGELFDSDKGRVFISEFFIQISNDCNLDCIYCSNENYTFREEGCKRWKNNTQKLNMELLKNAILEANDLQCKKISLIGGEPFLNIEMIKEIIDVVKKLNIKINIYTNLTLLNDEILNLLKLYSDINLIIDIVSLEREKYKKITRSNYNPDKLIKNIKLLKSNNINFNLRILLSKYNENDLFLINEKLSLEGLKVSEVKFVYPTLKQNYSSKRFKDFLDYSTKPKGNPSLESISLLNKFNNCLVGKIYLNLNGDWTPCPMMNTYKLGNIFYDNLGSIISSKRYKESSRLSRNKVSKCKNCSFNLNCTDCRALSYSQKGNIYDEYFCNREV